MASGDDTGGFSSNLRNGPSLKKGKLTIIGVEDRIRKMYMDSDGSFNWNSLTSIKLDMMGLRRDNVAKLLSGCPALEDMEFKFKESDYERMRWWLDYDLDVEIVAPYVQHLEISGCFSKIMCVLASVSSLVSAKLTYQNRCLAFVPRDDYVWEDYYKDSCVEFHECLRTNIPDNLQKLSYATELTELTIGSWATEVLCMLQLEVVLIPDLKCKYLMLELNIEQFSLYGEVVLLRASSHVETLIINMDEILWEGNHCQFELKYLAKGDSMDL